MRLNKLPNPPVTCPPEPSDGLLCSCNATPTPVLSFLLFLSRPDGTTAELFNPAVVHRRPTGRSGYPAPQSQEISSDEGPLQQRHVVCVCGLPSPPSARLSPGIFLKKDMEVHLHESEGRADWRVAVCIHKQDALHTQALSAEASGRASWRCETGLLSNFASVNLSCC